MGRWCVGNREKNTWERKTVNETKQGRERGKDRVIEKGLWERKQRELKTLEREISWKSASELGWSYLDCPASSKTTGWHRIVSLWNSTPRENNSQDYDIYANIPRNHDKWKKKDKQKYPKIKKSIKHTGLYQCLLFRRHVRRSQFHGKSSVSWSYENEFS